MDGHEEAGKVKAMLFVGIIFLLALTQSCTELQYICSGVTTTAVVEYAQTVTGRRGGIGVQVRYRFEDQAGETQNATVTFTPEAASALAPGSTFEIEYLPGRPQKSMPSGNRSMVWPTVLLVMLAIFGLILFSLFLDARRATRPSRR